MEKTSKRGGKRPNSGRPRSKDKKNIGFTVYARKSQVKAHGGNKEVKTKLETVVENPGIQFLIPAK